MAPMPSGGCIARGTGVGHQSPRRAGGGGDCIRVGENWDWPWSGMISAQAAGSSPACLPTLGRIFGREIVMFFNNSGHSCVQQQSVLARRRAAFGCPPKF